MELRLKMSMSKNPELHRATYGGAWGLPDQRGCACVTPWPVPSTPQTHQMETLPAYHETEAWTDQTTREGI